MMMKILLVWPDSEITFIGHEGIISLFSKSGLVPPLGLLTVAALLPPDWEKRLIDMNITPLKNEDILWADYVFISAFLPQRDSARRVIDQCKKAGIKIIVGGPLFTMQPECFIDDVDHMVLNEAENTLAPFLADLKQGILKKVYASDKFVDPKNIPVPLWDLVDFSKYCVLSIEYSRGCSTACDFCSTGILQGFTSRIKATEQFIDDLECLYTKGWRGDIFVVDDNFIGNKAKLKNELLPAMIHWSQEKNHPFSFFTQLSLDLADDDVLLRLVRDAGFYLVFIGIESPNVAVFSECHKKTNLDHNLLDSIDKIFRSGIIVAGQFTLGFDSDTPEIFDEIISFIQKSGIVIARIGLLKALPRTRLTQRLTREGRWLNESTGKDEEINFIPKMDHDILMSGYKKVMRTLYAPQQYNQRIKNYFEKYRSVVGPKKYKLSLQNIKAFLKTVLSLGIISKDRFYFWELFFWCFFRFPSRLSLCVHFMILCNHYKESSNEIFSNKEEI